ncbi:MAG: 30S ribosomal protein S16 [Alphaproteobacteria bacterium]|nr:30S ribosomal protein S16 [Alphaproteobacteria bacterium]
MSLRIRLARGGAKKRPFYRIVVAEVTSPRDGRFVEKLGTYNPMLPNDHTDRVVLNEDRIKHWLSVGARPTDRVHRMLGVAGLMDPFVYHDQPKKSAPGKKRTEREAEEAAKAVEANAAAAKVVEAKEIAAEEPVAEESVAEEPVAEEPVAEEPVIEEPVAAEEAAPEKAPAEEVAEAVVKS